MSTTEERAIRDAVDLAAARAEVRRQTAWLDRQWRLFIQWKRRSFHHWPEEQLEAYRTFWKAKGDA